MEATRKPKRRYYSQMDDALPIHLIVVGADGSNGDLVKLLDSLEPQVRDHQTDQPILTVVDNSTDQLLHQITKRCDWTRTITADRNLGYGAAINHAFHQLDPVPQWIVACNADLIFPTGSFSMMIRLARQAQPKVACIAPRLTDAIPRPDGRPVPQPSIGSFPTLISLLTGRLRPRTKRKYRQVSNSIGQNIDWATGACLMLRSTAFKQINGFDESMFLDYEDTDLCKRFADVHWLRRYEPRWVVGHTHPNAASPAKPERHIHTRASLMRYFIKHRPKWELHTLALLIRLTLMARRDDHPHAPAWNAAMETYRNRQSGLNS